jgi:ABC-type Fe3+-hydroxamate transport system substrate-binding protein
MYAPGSSIPIVDFEQGMALNPDLIFVLAWNFRDEIVKQCRSYFYKGEFLVPLPNKPYLYNGQ